MGVTGGRYCASARTERFLIYNVIAMLLTVFVYKAEQLEAFSPPDVSGCVVSPYSGLLIDHPELPVQKNVNYKSLKCYNVSIGRANREFSASNGGGPNGGENYYYKEILLNHLLSGDNEETFNVINEQQTEILMLIDSNVTDKQLLALFNENRNFGKLKNLDLGENAIQKVDREYFRRSKQLQVLNLAKNEIRELPNDVFLDLEELLELYLNNNNLLNFSSLGEIFVNLKRLMILDLSNNSISDFPRHLFNGLSNLLQLNMAHNKLNVVRFQVFQQLRSIEILDLSHNLFSTFLDNFFINNRELKILKLHHNNIRTISKNSLYGLKRLHTLDYSYNDLQAVDRNAFDTLDDLKHLNLANNKIQMFSPIVFLALKNLEVIDLSWNEMKQLPLGIFASQFQLREIRMDNMHLEKLSNWITRTNTNVTINKSVLKNLEYLSVRNNSHLMVIESNVFQNIPNLEKLYITNNQLTYLPKEIGELRGLQELDVSNNRLEFIPDGIKNLHNLVHLNLLGNDLLCDCHMYWMLQWIDELKSKNKTLPFELLRLSEMKCRGGYPGDIIRVLQHINCVKPYLLYRSEEKLEGLRTDALLECNFAGNPAPQIVWRTPHGEILRHSDNEVNPSDHLQLELQHRSLLVDTLENKKYQHIIESQMQNSTNLSEKIRSGPGITLLEKGFLRVHNLTRKDTGLYSCFAVNIMGNTSTDVR